MGELLMSKTWKDGVESVFIERADDEIQVDTEFLSQIERNPIVYQAGIDLSLTIHGKNKSVGYVYSLLEDEPAELFKTFHKVWEVEHDTQ